MIEAVGEVARHFKMLFLVFAYRNERCAVKEDVGSHESRVGEEAGVDILRMLPRLVFEGGGFFQFSLICQHVQEKIQFGSFGNMALTVERRFIGIEPAC